MNNVACQYRANRIELLELQSQRWPESAIPVEPGPRAWASMALPGPLSGQAPLRESLNEEFWETITYAVVWVSGLIAIILSWA